MASRDGFSLVEMLISVVVLTIVIGLALPFFRSQTMAVTRHAGGMEAQLGASFGIDAIDRDLRAGGIAVQNAQPLFVQASADAITFNSNLVARQASDQSAVYIDPDADVTTTTALDASRRVTLPLSGQGYPDTNYVQAGLPSLAETISYWLARDASSTYPDEFILWRRVNTAAPQVVASRIRQSAGEPMLQYFKTDSLGRPVRIPATSLPLYHRVPIHDSKADTGRNALIDSIRVVRVVLSGVHRDTRGGDVVVRLERSIRVMNAGLIRNSSCGDGPLMIGPVVATATNLPVPNVVVTWPPSSDEVSGEKDVERYVIYRRPAAGGSLDEPIASVAAGLATYRFDDNAVQSGESWAYAVAAQDCTPATSNAVLSNIVVVP